MEETNVEDRSSLLIAENKPKISRNLVGCVAALDTSPSGQHCKFCQGKPTDSALIGKGIDTLSVSAPWERYYYHAHIFTFTRLRALN